MGERGFDTSLGGAEGAFPETTWSLVARLREADASARRPGIEKLSRRYWKPVYQTIRLGWGKHAEDAKDLTQAFFVWLFEGETLARYVPERGSFRGYLKGLLRRFLADEHKAANRLKRGGGVEIFPLDDEVRSLEETIADPRVADPDAAFDRAWKKEILDAALAATRRHFADAEGRVRLRAFEEYDLAPADGRPTYGELAARLGVKETDVRNYLFAVRERLRAEVHTQLFETVADAAELQEEFSALFTT